MRGKEQVMKGWKIIGGKNNLQSEMSTERVPENISITEVFKGGLLKKNRQFHDELLAGAFALWLTSFSPLTSRYYYFQASQMNIRP